MLVDDGGGGGDPYQIKVNSVANGGEENSMGYQEIMQLLHGLKPGDMTAAAAAFKKLGNTLDQVTTKLRDQGSQLADSWSGEAASKAMAKFQQLHDQAAQLAAQAHTTSNTMNWMGTEVMPKFQSLPAPSVMGKSEADGVMGSVAGPGGALVGMGLGAMGIGPNGQAKADQAAREYMKSFNQAMTQANSQLPASTAGPNSQFSPGQWTAPGTTSGPGASGTGAGYAGIGGTSGTGGSAPSSYTPPSGTGHVNLASLNRGSNGPTGSLQGYSPPGGTGGSPFGGSHGNLNQPSPGPNPFEPVPVPPGGGYGSGKGVDGEGDGVSGEDGLGGNRAASGEAAAGEKALGQDGLSSEGGADAAGATGADAAAGEAAGAEGAMGAAEGEGLGAMPMGGMGGGGESGKERQRQAWMNEDVSIWGAPTEETGSVIE